MKARGELRTGLRLLIMALVFLAMSCEDDSDGGDGCLGDTDGLVTGCSDGCGTDVWMIKGNGCLSDCIFDSDGCNLTGEDGCGDCGGDEGCGDCGGCGSDDPYDYDGDVVEGAVQIHVTDSLFTFMETGLMDVLGAALGDEMDIDENGKITMCFPVGDEMCPRDNEAVDNCGGSGEKGCRLQIKLGKIEIEPHSDEEIRVRVNVDDIDGKIRASQAGGCTISLSRQSGAFYIELRPQLHVNPVDGNTELYIGGGDHIGVDTSGLNLGMSGILCWMGGALDVDDTIKGTIGGVPCRGCNNDADCGGGGWCSNNICRDDSGRECQGIQLGAELGLDAGGLLQSIDPGAEAKLGLLAFLGSYVETNNNGLQLAMRLGGEATEPSLCVPERPSPISAGKNDCRTGDNCQPLAALNEQGTVTFEDADGNEITEEFHIGAGVAMGGLNQILYAAYNSGALCLSVSGDSGMEELEMLATDLIGVLVGSLSDLAVGNQPMMLQIRPQYAPEVDFAHVEGNGAEIRVKLKELALDFYTVVDLRYQRVFTLSADIELPLTLSVSNNELDIAIGSLADLIDPDTATVSNVEMLSVEEVETMVGQLPSIIDGAVGGLLGDDLIPKIDIGDLAGDALGGLNLSFVGPGLQIIDEGDKPAALGLFMKLELDEPDSSAPGGLRNALEPEITDLHIDIKNSRELRADLAAMRRAGESTTYHQMMPKIVAEVATTGGALSQDQVEYAYSINNGPWSYWEKGPVLNIDRPRLALEEKYEVRIRARRAGDASSGSKHYAAFDFVNDYTAPTVTLEADGSSVSVVADDNVYDVDELVMQYRLNGGQWSERAPLHEIDVASDIKASERVSVDVSVEDPSGNARIVRRVFGEKTTPLGQTDSGASAEGCASSQGNGGLLGVLALIGLLFVRRRQPGSNAVAASPMYVALALFAVLMLAMGATGCKSSGSSFGENELCDPECSSHETCEHGVCEAMECKDVGDCPGGSECLDGNCVRVDSCGHADDCEYGHICKDDVCTPSECSDSSQCSHLTCEGEELPFCEYDDWSTVEAGECLCLSGVKMNHHGSWINAHELSDGSVVVLAYHDTYGDVILGTLQSDDTFDWDFVDGVPEGPVLLPPSGVRGGVRAAGDDAGLYVSSALEKQESGDVLHAAYQYESMDEGTTSLRYARGVKGAAGWAWITIDIDSIDITGIFPSIVVLPGQEADEEDEDAEVIEPSIAIVYATADVVREGADETENTKYFSEVSTAYAANTAPESAEDFQIVDGFVQEESDLACGGLCASRALCHVEKNTCVAAANGCDPDCESGEECVEFDGDKICAKVEAGSPTFNVIPRGIGLFSSSVVDENGVVHNAYYDQIHGNLVYVTLQVERDAPEDNGTLAVKDGPLIVDGELNGESTGDVGRWTHIQVLDDGRAVIFYEDAGRAELRGAVINGTNVSITVLAEGVYIEQDRKEVSTNRVGASVSANALEEGGFEVFFQDSTDSILRRVVWDDLDAQPSGAELGVYGTEDALARDPSNASKNADPSERLIAAKDGAYGFFAKVLNLEDRQLFISKRVAYEDGGVLKDVSADSLARDVPEDPEDPEDP